MIRQIGLVHRKSEDGEDISKEALAKLRKYNESRGVRGQKRKEKCREVVEERK